MSAAVLLAAAGADAREPVLAGGDRIAWRGSKYGLAELPAELGAPSRDALEQWVPWADAQGYRLDLTDDGRVLLIVHEKSKAARERELLAKTIALVDRIAPPSALRPITPDREPPAEPPVRADPGVDPGATTWSFEDTGPPLETETAVLLEFEDVEDYRAALAHLAARHDYLKSWTGEAKDQSGFVLERPLCASWIASGGPGMEEWDPQNELVNRTAQLLFLRRFGRQPFWLSMGLAWYVEEDVRGGIYCFPYRDDFVFATEHAGWDKELKRLHKKVERLSMEDLSGWHRGTFDRDRALRAFGLATFLAEEHRDALPGLFAELLATTRRVGRVDHPDGTWELIPGFELPAAEQQAIFARHLGEDWLEDLLAYFKKGLAKG